MLEGRDVDVLYEEVVAVRSDGKLAYLQLEAQTITADYLFSSIMPGPLVQQPGRQYLWQHFKGWTVRMDEDCFTADTATLMDFRISQQHGASFVYILPFGPRRAMVEYTIFSPALLPDESYTEGLRSYLEQRFPGVRYVVEEEERGKIPMTDHRFPQADGRIIYMGTAGGYTKGSSGYTFSFIQSHTAQLAEALARKGTPQLSQRPARRHAWYDAILLRVLAQGRVPATLVFERLFGRNSPQQVLRFLDNASTIAGELKLISSLPIKPFLRAAASQLTGVAGKQQSSADKQIR
jgi:lycopene beta-cyclase